MGCRRAERAAGQRHPARRPADGEARPDFRGRRHPDGNERREEGRRPDAVPAHLPHRSPALERRWLLHAGALAHRARALRERLPDRRQLGHQHAGRPARRRNRDGQRPAPHRPAKRRVPGRAGACRQVRLRGGARPTHREGAGDGHLARLQPEPGRAGLRGDRAHEGRLRAAGPAAQPWHLRPLHAGFNLQGDHDGSGSRLGLLRPRIALHRPRLLHRVRQEGLELLRPERAREVRPGDAHRRARPLDQRGVLRDRQDARPQDDPLVRQAVRLLLDAAAGDTGERARPERPLQRLEAVPAEGCERGRPGAHGLRAGANAGDATPDGDGDGRGRQRRHRDEALRRRPRDGARRHPGCRNAARGARPCDQAGDGRPAQRHAGAGGDAWHRR